MNKHEEGEKDVKEKIADRLTYEYEKFRLQMLCTSRENIYANAEQIRKKKIIMDEVIKHLDEIPEDKAEKMLSRFEILDSLYLLYSEKESTSVLHENVKPIIEQFWLLT